MIYLDNCSTTRPRPEVLEYTNKIAMDYFSNPSSIHSLGVKSKELLEDCRKVVADSINGDPDQIVFTSGGTESSLLFHHGLLSRENNRVTILTSSQEHPATTEVLKYYEDRGYDLVYIECDSYGRVDIESLKKNLSEDVLLATFIHVNNQLGTINDIGRISQVIREYNPNIKIFVDGVQAFGKLEIDIKKLDVDGYSMSSHKIHGLNGTGALFIKDENIIDTTVLGGGQERGLRSGTENLIGIAGFKKAIELIDKDESNYLRDLKGYLIDRIDAEIPRHRINTPLDSSVACTLNISFENTIGEIIVRFLEMDQIYISTSSACDSNRKGDNNLKKLGHSDKISQGSIRICLSYENTREEIDIFVQKLKFAVENIRMNTEG